MGRLDAYDHRAKNAEQKYRDMLILANQINSDTKNKFERLHFMIEQKAEDLLCEREAIESQAPKAEAEARPSHLLAIAGLLELLLDNNRPRYNQGSAADTIGAKGWYGASHSALTKLFADAKVAAKDADMAAQAKTEAREMAAKKPA